MIRCINSGIIRQVALAVALVWAGASMAETAIRTVAETAAETVVPIVAPYTMGFEEEDADEMANWVLNPGTQAAACMDQWVVGEARNNGGHKSLYISCDGGESAEFGARPDVQYVYRDFTIAKGGYDVSFDWSCKGVENVSVLYAAVAPVSSVSDKMNASAISGALSKDITTWVTGASGTGALIGDAGWSNASIHINSNGTATYRLFFVWRNTNTDTTVVMPVGGCIDNIQITSDRCQKPKKLSAETGCDTIKLSWRGSSTSYCLEYRRRGSKRWIVTTGIEKDDYILEGLDEGMYDFRVRGVCDTDTSAYRYLNGVVVFCPDKHCINYVTLTDSDNVECAYGTYKEPRRTIGVVDYGCQDKYSRHTVVWEPGLYDPRTKNQLPLIPEGELASVRLGNWNNGGEGESITFMYQVDLKKAAILLLKYAIVLEDPNHGPKDNPRFTMEILDETGALISPTCGAADFYADASRKDGSWHAASGVPGASSVVSWKEWTTVGLNLEEVGVKDGELLQIRLTTKDCAWSAHFGYAYFTLGCAAAQIAGTSCGDESVMSVEAPRGFTYAWYNEKDSLVSTTMQLTVDSWDIQTYRCTLTSMDNEECSFDLYTKVRPRFPFADFTYKYDPADCQNRVRFTNKSHVITKEGETFIHNTDELCDDYEWDFGNGMLGGDRNPVINFPRDGGDFDVTLTASISEGACRADTTIRIHLPKIGDTQDTIRQTICDGSYVEFGKYFAALPGFYTEEKKSKAGCDSVVTLELSINPVDDVQLPDTTICAEEALTIDGKTYPRHESGRFIRFYQNQYGCDSTVWMDVTVLDSILPQVRVKEMTDEPNSGALYISGEGFDYYIVNGGEPQPWSEHMDMEGLNGGVFEIEFFNNFGCSITRTYAVSPCLVGHIYQRWDNVLSLRDSAMMAETDSLYGFTDFQWYKNDVAIEGANMSYLYVEGGFKKGDVYTLEMTRISNGERVETCPFVPATKEEKAHIVIYPSPVRKGGELTVKSDKAGTVSFTNMLGESAGSASIVAGENTVTAPAVAGIYVVQVQTDTETLSCQISVMD